MRKHTPGPWDVEFAPDDLPHLRGAWNVAAGVGRYRCVVASRNLWPHRGGESDANAHLIAAAPDLLAALKWAHQHCTMLYGNGDAMVDAMSAAIARAEGKP